MQLLQIEIPLETINAAITALSTFPYKEAAPHINALQQAGQTAIADLQAKAQSEPGLPVAEEGSEGGNAD